jgi:hypothetical protein
MTRIADLLGKGRTYSFEFFPPKTDAEQATLVKTLRDLEPLGPSFVSVTYRGGAESRRRTFDLVTGMLRTTTLVPMAHLICVAHTRLELAEILVAYRSAGVENLMALGGDPPVDPDEASGELIHASELVELAHAIGGFSVGVAAQPGYHPNSPDPVTDRDFLAAKLARADFAISQFFFEAEPIWLPAGWTNRCCRASCLSPASARSPVWPPWARRCRSGWFGGWRRPIDEAGRTRCATRVWRSPLNSVSSCSTPGFRGCTSTRSTGRVPPVRSTPPSAWPCPEPPH